MKRNLTTVTRLDIIFTLTPVHTRLKIRLNTILKFEVENTGIEFYINDV